MKEAREWMKEKRNMNDHNKTDQLCYLSNKILKVEIYYKALRETDVYSKKENKNYDEHSRNKGSVGKGVSSSV